MRVDFMKWVDRWAGGFGCFALDMLELPLRPLRRRQKDPAKVKVVLITKYLGMGSIILAAPMVAEIRKLYPNARVVFLTFEENRDLCEMLGIFDEILTLNSRRLLRLGLDTFASLVRLWRLGVDVVCDLEFFTRFSTMMAYLSGARTRVGYWSRIAWRGHLLTHPVYYNGTKHITRVFLALAGALGARIDEKAPCAFPELKPDASGLERARKALSESGLDSKRPLMLVNPNASELCFERRWMPERFAAVVDQMLEAVPGLQAAYIGSNGERDYTAGVAGKAKHPERIANLAGRLDLRGLAELFRLAGLFLTNDSGPLHLASLMGTPIVSLFGPETPALYGSLGLKQKTFYAGVYCSPCLNVYNSKTASCDGNNVCLQEISEAEVAKACLSVLSPA
jgi:ADP-heptose:LPS heptosyltransferase